MGLGGYEESDYQTDSERSLAFNGHGGSGDTHCKKCGKKIGTGNHQRGHGKHYCSCWCFLTTACVEFNGLSDVCKELITLRKFRDEYVRTLPNGEELIKEYYATAPSIVEAIKKQNKEETFDYIFDVITECVELIKVGNNEEALKRYRGMFDYLHFKFVFHV